MTHELHSPIYRKPVGMDIGETHENAYLDTPIVEIFVFINFLDDYDLAIGRCNYNFVGIIHFEIPYRTLVEIDSDGINCTEDQYKNPKWPLCIERKPYDCCNDDNRDKSEEKCIGSLTVYADLFYFFYSLAHVRKGCTRLVAKVIFII